MHIIMATTHMLPAVSIDVFVLFMLLIFLAALVPHRGAPDIHGHRGGSAGVRSNSPTLMIPEVVFIFHGLYLPVHDAHETHAHRGSITLARITRKPLSEFGRFVRTQGRHCHQ